MMSSLSHPSKYPPLLSVRTNMDGEELWETDLVEAALALLPPFRSLLVF